MKRTRGRAKPLGAVGRKLVEIFDQKYGPGEWTQSMVARDTGYSESSISRHLSASRIHLDTALTYQSVYGVGDLKYLAPQWKPGRRVS